MVDFLENFVWVALGAGLVVLAAAIGTIYRGAKVRRRGRMQAPAIVPPVAESGNEVVGGILIGGLYASQNKDGTFTVSKVLDVNFAVHVQIYRETFPSPPAQLASSQLTVALGHAPMAGDGWVERHFLVGREPVRDDELEGYRIYLEA